MKSEPGKFAGFVFWGACSYLFALSIMYLLTQVLHLPNKPAYALTQTVILPINFLLNRYLVFLSTSEHLARQGIKYLVANASMRIVDWLVFAFLEGVLGWPYYTAVFCGMCAVYPLKFAAYRIGVFGAPPQETLEETEPGAGYAPAQDRMALLPNYYRWMFRHLHSHIRGDVVDLGCGKGHDIGHYLGDAGSVTAVDGETELLTQLESRLNSAKITTVVADLGDDWNFVADRGADTIIAFDILEHIEDDNRAAGRIARKLKRGGKVIVKVPARSSLYGPIDEASGHFRRYDPAQLTALMTDAGLQTVFCRQINPLGGLVYALRRKRRTDLSRTFTPGQLRMINWLIPLLMSLDRLSFLPGLSLLAVYVRPE